jgi:hypothetical protein
MLLVQRAQLAESLKRMRFLYSRNVKITMVFVCSSICIINHVGAKVSTFEDSLIVEAPSAHLGAGSRERPSGHPRAHSVKACTLMQQWY